MNELDRETKEAVRELKMYRRMAKEYSRRVVPQAELLLEKAPPVAGLGLPQAVLLLGKVLASPDMSRVMRQEQVAAAGAAIRTVMAALPPARMLWTNMRVGPSARGDDGLWIALEWIVAAQHLGDDPPAQHFDLLCAHTILESWRDWEAADSLGTFTREDDA